MRDHLRHRPREHLLDGRNKAVYARIQDDFIIDRNGTLQRLALFQAAALWAQQQEIHSSENRAEKEQRRQWTATAL